MSESRHLGRVEIDFSLLEELLGLPPGLQIAWLNASNGGDVWRLHRMELILEGDMLPVVNEGEVIPQVTIAREQGQPHCRIRIGGEERMR